VDISALLKRQLTTATNTLIRETSRHLEPDSFLIAVVSGVKENKIRRYLAAGLLADSGYCSIDSVHWKQNSDGEVVDLRYFTVVCGIDHFDIPDQKVKRARKKRQQKTRRSRARGDQ